MLISRELPLVFCQFCKKPNPLTQASVILSRSIGIARFSS